MNIHRRIISEEGGSYLHDIGYEHTAEGLIDITKISIHPVQDDGTVGNDSSASFPLSYASRLVSLKTLVEDGVVKFP
jgi:hypothetical protein